MRRLTPLQIMTLLRGTDLLKGVPEADLASLVRYVRHSHAAAGELIFSKESTETSVYCVADGRVKITSTGRDGNEFLLGVIEPGEMFGVFALADGAPRASDAVADRDSYLLGMTRRELLPIVESHPSSAMAFSRMLSSLIRQSMANLENIGLHDAKARLWLRLMELGDRYGRVGAEAGSLRIVHGLSQQDLADSIGLSRVIVNRKLGVWRAKGLIEHGRGVIEIRDPDALEAYVWRDEIAGKIDPM